MSYADERKAIESRFATNFTAVPVRYENVPFDEISTVHVALFIVDGAGIQASLGARPLFRWAGVISAKLLVPEQGGTQAILEHADTIEAIWRNAEFSAGNSGVIRCRVPSVQRVGVIHGWYQINVVTPYIRDRVFS